jgi:hypothetical protein
MDEHSVSDARLPFDEALGLFRRFLASQGWPSDIAWLSEDRVVGHRRTHWVLRPDELTSDAASRAFYEMLRTTGSSIRLDALGTVHGRTIAYVNDYGGDSRMLNCGVNTSGWELRAVTSRVAWLWLVAMTRLRGTSPFLQHTRFTPRSTGTRGLKPGAHAV